ncbi:hypothetical protein [Lysinibacillus capsici]|nr:hypothetical protein [Lysinibacillus capsici]
MDYEKLLMYVSSIVGILGGLSSIAVNIQTLTKKNTKKRRNPAKNKRR